MNQALSLSSQGNGGQKGTSQKAQEGQICGNKLPSQANVGNLPLSTEHLIPGL